MYVFWLDVLDVISSYKEYQKLNKCSDFELNMTYGLSFMFAPVGVFFCLLSGLLFLVIGRTVQHHSNWTSWTVSKQKNEIVCSKMHPKMNFCHYLLTHMSFQTCMDFFLLLNTKEDILKNVGNQTVDGSHSMFSILWMSMAAVNCLVTNILQNMFFMSFLGELSL